RLLPRSSCSQPSHCSENVKLPGRQRWRKAPPLRSSAVEQGTQAGRIRRARHQVSARISRNGAVSAAVQPERVTLIEADAPRARVELRELWRARDLAFVFAWRDVKVRYKQTLIGAAWAVIQPFATM